MAQMSVRYFVTVISWFKASIVLGLEQLGFPDKQT